MSDRSADPELDAWGFAFPGPLRDELTALDWPGPRRRRPGSSPSTGRWGRRFGPGRPRGAGGSDEHAVAIVETVESRIVRLADVDDQHAIDEGEGFANATDFRVAHERFWNGFIDNLRARIGPDFTIDDDTLVVLQRFRVMERPDPD
jgi:hypothetical protein